MFLNFMVDDDMPSSTSLEATSVRWPNLFLIGAPKCGTTAMSHYLASHPQIYMSEEAGMKEPHFFNADHSKAHDQYWDFGRTEGEYLSLFNGAPKTVEYMGDASVFYLYSKVAVPEIIKKNKNSKLVAMVRNPVHLAVSLFNQNYKNNQENVKSFEDAWYLQRERAIGVFPVPKFWNDRRLLLYGEIAKTGEQLARVLDVVDREQLHVIVYDDFSVDPHGAYRGILEFLGVEDDGRQDFPVLNPRKDFRIPSLEFFMRRLSVVRQRLGIPGGWGINALIDSFNVVEGRKPDSLSPELLADMVAYFRDDVALLSEILGRDFSHWLEM